MEEKIKYLLGVGFRPISNSKDNTIYIRNKYIVTVSSEQKLEDLKREVEEALKREDLVERNTQRVEAESHKESAKETPEGGAETEGGQGLPFEDEEENPFVANSEDVDPTYVAEALKCIVTPVFRRLSLDGNRYYYRQLDDGSIKIYASGTNLIKDGYADNKDTLNEWKQQMKLLGHDPEKVAEYEADKGTIMHYLFDLYLMGRDIYLRRSHIIKLVEESDVRISKENMKRFKSSTSDLDNMIERLKRFAKFCRDYKVKPLLIEKILSCEEYEVASPIDLVCQMSIEETVEGYFGEVYKRASGEHKAGDPKLERKKVEKKIYAIIDFKSGGIYPTHALQLELYRRMVNTWYKGIIHIEKIYNFSPKSESSKGYTLRDQTECKELRKADLVYGQGMINHQNKDKVYKTSIGKLNINEEYNENDHIIVYDIAEELRKTFES